MNRKSLGQCQELDVLSRQLGSHGLEHKRLGLCFQVLSRVEVCVGSSQNDRPLGRGNQAGDGAVKAIILVLKDDVNVFKQDESGLVEILFVFHQNIVMALAVAASFLAAGAGTATVVAVTVVLNDVM